MLIVRAARPEDAAEVAGVHVRSWQVGYRGLIADGYLDGLRPEDRMAHYRFGDADPQQPLTIVAIDHGDVCGFATTGPSRDPDAPDRGEVFALYVDPPAWGLGVGRRLMAAARANLAELDFSAAILWVLSGNERAQRFYTIDGWRPDNQRRSAEVWNVRVEEVRYERTLP